MKSWMVQVIQKGLTKNEMSVQARIMAIADILKP